MKRYEGEGKRDTEEKEGKNEEEWKEGRRVGKRRYCLIPMSSVCKVLVNTGLIKRDRSIRFFKRLLANSKNIFE